MAALNFIGGEKGGVGKSVLSRVIAQYHIDRNLPFLGFDTDRSHPTLTRFYADYAAPTVIDDYRSLDHLAEAISEQPERSVLVDLAAQTFAPLARWMEDSGVLTLLKEAGITVRYWHVMDDGQDALGLLDRLLDHFGDRVAYVVVLNHGRGSDFSAFHHSPAKARALSHQAAIVELRRLHDGTMRAIDLGNASFWSAINHRGGEQSLGMFDRQRVKVWLAKTYTDLSPLL
jgi:hypothetical protein